MIAAIAERRGLARIFVGVAACLVTPVIAQDPPSSEDPPAAPPLPVSVAVERPQVTGVLATTVASQYFFRGILQEDRGFILQPNLEITFGLFEDGAGSLSSGALTLGTWNSLHSGPSGTRGRGQAWYESDFYADLSVATSGGVKLDCIYTAYASPNGAFGTVEEIAVAVAWDDKPCWQNTTFGGLQPSATVAFELDGQVDGGSKRGIYGEVAVAPGFTLRPRPRREGDPSAGLPIALSMPLTVGLGIGNYYEQGGTDGVFGYVDVGFAACFTLPAPARFGVWTVTAGVDLLWLGDEAAGINRGDDFEVIGALTLRCAF